MKLNKDIKSILENTEYPSITKKEKKTDDFKVVLTDQIEEPVKESKKEKPLKELKKDNPLIQEIIVENSEYSFLDLTFSSKLFYNMQKGLLLIYFLSIILSCGLAYFSMYFWALGILLMETCLFALFGIVVAFQNEDNNILFFNTVISASFFLWIIIVFLI